MSENDNGEIKTILESLKAKYEKGELSKEEYESLKAKYTENKAEKLQFSLIEVSGSAKITSEYISVSGSARIDGYKGKGDSLKISGSGRISNDEIFISGNGKIPGDVKTKKFENTGTVKVLGDINVEELTSSGNIKIAGNAVIRQAKISGSSKFLANITAEDEFDASGSLAVEGKLTSFDVRLTGSFRIGEIEAKGLFFAKISGKSRTSRLSADTVMVESPRGAIFTVDEITAGGVAELENVVAKKVTAEKIKLYGDCRIEEIIETGKE